MPWMRSCRRWRRGRHGYGHRRHPPTSHLLQNSHRDPHRDPHHDSRRDPRHQAGPGAIVRMPLSVHVPTNAPAAAAQAQADSAPTGPTIGQPNARRGRKTIAPPMVPAARWRAQIGTEKLNRAAAFHPGREQAPDRALPDRPHPDQPPTGPPGINRPPARGHPIIALHLHAASHLLKPRILSPRDRPACASMRLNRTRPVRGATTAQPPAGPHSIEERAPHGLPLVAAPKRTVARVLAGLNSTRRGRIQGPAQGPIAPVLPRHDSINPASISRYPRNPASTDPVLNGRASIVNGPIVPERAAPAQTGPVQVDPALVVRAQVVPGQAVPGQAVRVPAARFAAKGDWRGLSPPVPANRALAARAPAPSRVIPAVVPLAPGLALALHVPGVRLLVREVNPVGSQSPAAPVTNQNPQAACAAVLGAERNAANTFPGGNDASALDGAPVADLPPFSRFFHPYATWRLHISLHPH